MNKWVKKSIELANKNSYLDKLFKVYPVESGEIRMISEKAKNTIHVAFKNKNKKHLIKKLLDLPRFPIDDPYLASIRKYPHLLDKNPKTVYRIGKKLLSLGFENILELATRPKSPSRQLGNSFKVWLQKIDYPFVDENEFLRYKDVAFLLGSDAKLKKFVIEKLEITDIEKRPDFILKIRNKIIIGEAKFLTDYGGTQNNQFRDAINVTEINKKNIIGIAVIDGIVWFNSNSFMHRTIREIKGMALSSLLLQDFIKS
jgi:hypothetical protein